MAVGEAQQTGPFLKGSIIWQKKGPLPVWAWAAIGLGVVLAVSMWRRNKAEATSTEVATGDPGTLPGNQSAGPIFVVPGAATPAVNVTVPTAPPGAGRPRPPGVTPYVPPNGTKTEGYKVLPGQTWDSLLYQVQRFWHYGGTKEQLAAANGLSLKRNPPEGRIVNVYQG